MRFIERRVTVVCGHYGTGKTNLSINLALDCAREGEHVTLIDMDVVNPAIAPSVGNPTPGGIFVHELETILENLCHKNIVGLDVVETASNKLGDHTAVVAAKIIYDFLTLID